MRIKTPLNFLSRKYLIVGLIISGLTFMTVRCNISEENVLKIYNEIRKSINFNLNNADIFNEVDNRLNEKINKNPNLLKFKIKSEVDSAILKYEKITDKQNTNPIYSEKPINTSLCYTPECQALGGEIRLCSPWVDTCPPALQTLPNSIKATQITP